MSNGRTQEVKPLESGHSRPINLCASAVGIMIDWTFFLTAWELKGGWCRPPSGDAVSYRQRQRRADRIRRGTEGNVTRMFEGEDANMDNFLSANELTLFTATASGTAFTPARSQSATRKR